MSVIHNLVQFPLGIKWWKQVYKNLIPSYEVFKCIGLDTRTGNYLFVSKRSGSKILRNIHQVNHNGFEPFLYVNHDFVAPASKSAS